MNFSKTLTLWYSKNKRDLPWRNTQDPYKIWLSEIILQQTQVKQGLPYYESFLKAFPSVVSLANAKEEDVLKLWQGLGYYSRARNLHATAKIIHKELNNEFPNSYSGLIKLKGIGDYTQAQSHHSAIMRLVLLLMVTYIAFYLASSALTLL